MDRRKIYFSGFAFGFAAMAAQILLMRELLVVFYGNELSYGIMLASWLFWAATGSLAARFKRSEEEIFCLLLLSVAMIIPATICLIRETRNILGVSAGELIGLLPMALSTFILLAPACLVFGSLFPISVALLRKTEIAPSTASAEASASAVGKIYAIESFGAVAGGLAFNFLLVHMLGPFQIALSCGLMSIAAVVAVSGMKKGPVIWVAVSFLMCYVAIDILAGSRLADFRMRELQWKGLELITVRDSKYGNIALTRLGSQLNLFENGLLTAATKDPLTAEESVHYALLEHPAPARVLLIGGAFNGALDEVLKEPVRSVDCVELDPETTDLAKERYPAALLKGLYDPRTKIHYLDGRLFVKNSGRQAHAAYDVIILTLPNPYTAQINRFYSLEFYREVKRLLDARGIFSFGVTSSADYVSGEQAQFLGCLYKTLKGEFSDIKILPGETAFFFASPSGGILTYDYKVLEERIKERNLDLGFVNSHYLPDKFQTMRIEYLEKSVRDAYASARINRDFKPIGYFYDMVLWSARLAHSSRLKDFFKKMSRLNPGAVAGGILAVFAGLALFRRLSGRPKDMAVVLSIGTTGFSTMLLQVVIIIAFQVMFGYVYQKIGLIFASFMLGLAGGSLTAVKLIEKGGDIPPIYWKTQLALCAYSFALPFIFRHPLSGEMIFSVLPAAAGFIGGMQFPLANRICAQNGKDTGKIGRLLYGVDLIGACAGALVTSAFFIPVFGIGATCYLTGLLNALVLGLLLSGDQLFLSKT